MSDDTIIEGERVGAPTTSDAGSLLRLAIDKGVSVEALEKLVMLHERVADRAAAAEFANALAEFQKACPSIPKTSEARVTGNSGVSYSYRYAELDQIANTIRPYLHQHGLSYTWDSKLEEGAVAATCTLRHVNGHAVSASFSAPVESASRMTAVQKHASALTYAKRQALVQVLGLTTCEPDDDAGHGSSETITDKQAADLEAMISEVGANEAKFLAWAKVKRLEDIRAADYSAAVAALRRKRQ